MDLYKQSFPRHASDVRLRRLRGFGETRRCAIMVTATSSTSGRNSTSTSAVARVAIAGATGFAGQELVRILARHPRCASTPPCRRRQRAQRGRCPRWFASGTAPWSALDVDRLAADADIVFLALPEAASADLHRSCSSAALASSICPGRSAFASDADRQRWYPATTTLPARNRLRPDGAEPEGDRRRASGVESRLLSNRGAARTGAADVRRRARRARS
jgi:hypothetical protein